MRESWERYLNEVVSYVRFPFDRGKIRQEMADHIEDLYEDLCSQEMEEAQAAQLALEWMGDSEEVGKALDREHHPVLGWTWLVLGIVCVLLVLKTVFGIVDTGWGILRGYREELEPASESAVVYTIYPEIEKQLYHDKLMIDKIVYYEDGTLAVDYATWHNPLERGTYWTLSIHIDALADGEKYNLGGGGYKNGGYYGKGQICLQAVPADADTLLIYAGTASMMDGMPLEISLTEGRVTAE